MTTASSQAHRRATSLGAGRAGRADRPEPPTRVVAVMFFRELTRRWPTIAFMVFMPASYFIISYLTSDATTRLGLSVPQQGGAGVLDVLDRDVKALYLAVLGIGVTASFAALSAVQNSHEVSRRLRMAGLSAGRLLLARILVLAAVMLASCLVFLALFAPLVETSSLVRAGVSLFVVSAIGVSLGTIVGVVLPRQFEAAMVLIAFAGIQMALGRGGSDAERLLPYWPGIEALKSAVFAPSPATTAPLALGAAYAVGLFAIAAVLWTARTRVWRGRGEER